MSKNVSIQNEKVSKNQFSSNYFMELESKYGAHNYHPLEVVLSKGDGAFVWDVEGKKYLDCLSAYSAVNQGHRHPKIIEAAKIQLENLTLTSRAFYNDRLGLFLKKLCDLAEMEVALPMNTGAEAVETGIKMARRWGYEIKKVQKNSAEIIVCENNFHGRTTTIVGFSSDENSRKGFGPFTPGFIEIPFNDPKALEEAITDNTVAFLVEPIQGEAGVIIPDEGYLKKIREICSKNNILLILDEIQTGLCRTGKMFAYMHENIKPDILLVGKALGGGVIPVSGALSSKEIMAPITPGSHGSTYAGSPLACAIAEASLEVLIDEKLAENSYSLGKYFKKGLEDLNNPLIKEIRGKGLFVAIELFEKAGNARKFTTALKEKGILAKETHEQTIRFAPPLIINEEDIDLILATIKETIK
ncbi:MAG: Ornithine aminotransferase [Candidatus Heimdallarchaeota archaeon LC_3]|nr:MAG: Ornithine aminotransferase [Candidatus Heimdallarchaeota archaeon LC_3]